ERQQRHQDGPGAQHDNHVREPFSPAIADHAVSEAAMPRTTFTGRVRVCRPSDQMNAREMMLITSVMKNSTRPISTSELKWSGVAASANSFASTADMVYCGANSDVDTCGVLPMTIVTAIVSPSARPKPSMTAPTIPVRA